MLAKAPLFLGKAVLIVTAALLPSCGAAMEKGAMFSRSPGLARAGSQESLALEHAIELVSQLRYDEAASLLDPLVSSFENAHDIAHSGEAIFWLGYCREKQGRTAEAIVWYRRLLERYGQTDAARMARDRLDALTMPVPPTGPS